MIAAPLMQIVGFGLHPQLLSFAKESDAVIQMQYTQNLNWAIGHVLVLLSLPLLLLVFIQLGELQSQIKPWHALVGTSVGGFGIIMMAGIFGATLAQGAVGTVSVDDSSLLALQAIMDMQGPLPVLFLGALMMVGGMILAWGLYSSRAVPRFSSVLFFLGNLILLVWMDIDAIMAFGSLCILVGLYPVAQQLMTGASGKSKQGAMRTPALT
jgi:hypothetical protein